MTTMPQIRKNLKFFANGKNDPLVKLSTMVMDTEEVIAVLGTPEGSEFNTCLQVRRDLFPLLPIDATTVTYDKRYQQRSIMYDRISLINALRIEFGKDESNVFLIDPETFYANPVELEAFIDVLNKKYGYDMTTDDISITHTAANNYTITARPNSLQYFGQASVNLGLEDDIPPVILVPSHDSVWENGVIDLNQPANVNGNNVSLKNYQAMYQAGIAFVQYKIPDLAWVIWTGGLQGEATLEAVANGTQVSAININETPTVTGKNLYAKYVPFVPNTTIPSFVNPITAVDFKQTMQFMFPYAPSLDKLVSIWINDQLTTVSDLLKPAGAHGFKLVMDELGESTLTHDGQVKSNVIIRVNVPTLPNLARTNSRFIYGILRSGNHIPMDVTGREVYCIEFPERVVIVPDPSEITMTVPTNQEDYSAALEKIASGLVLNYTDYRKCNPTITIGAGGRQILTATVESETFEARFPAFYFIKQKDWDVIESQPINTVIGTYTAVTIPVTNVGITVGLLLSSTVPVSGGRLLCLVGSIPAKNDATFKLNYQPGSEYYKETTSNMRLEIAYNKASLIIPRDLDEAILKDIVAGTMTGNAFAEMMVRQQEVNRYINQVGEQWYASYEFSPYNPPQVLSDSLDENGLYILQLMSIPGAAMTQIQTISVLTPNAVILKLTDTGGINTIDLTARDIMEKAVVQSNTGDGYLCFKHNKTSGATQVRWVFKTDYDGPELTYRETTTNLTITDSIIDNPGVPFTATYQECINKEQYDLFRTIVSEHWPLNYLDWKYHKLNIGSPASSGIFTKYGNETVAGYTVGRLLLGSEYVDWFRNGSYVGMPDEDPVVVRLDCPEMEVEFAFTASYIKSHIDQVGGIPIPLPLFDDQERVLPWTVDFSWFGFTNPPRPAPSPLPNLYNGTILTNVTHEIRPIQKLPSLFEFTERQSTQENAVMLSTLINLGKPVSLESTVLNRYDAFVQSDVVIETVTYGRNEQHWYTTWNELTGPEASMQVISIDLAILNAFKNGEFTEEQLETVIFTYTPDTTVPDFVDRSLTLRQIRERGIISTSEGFIPVTSQVKRVEAFANPNQETQTWIADYSILNLAGDEYEVRRLKLATKVYLTSGAPAELRLSGPSDYEFENDMNLVAKDQWPSKTMIPIVDQDLTANNNFGLWNVTFLNKGKTGFEVLHLTEDAMSLVKTAFALAPDQKILTITVTANINNYNQAYSYTAREILTRLKEGTELIIPLDAFVVRGNYEYTIYTRLSYTGTTSNVGDTIINNLTSVKDGTPPDITVDARWTTPANDTELANWSSSVGLNPIPLSRYRMEVTQYNYTHNVEVELSNVEYVAALKIEKSVRERIIENQYTPDTIVGLWNGEDLLADHLINGPVDADGDNILLVRAPISITVNNSYILSFSISGIQDYNQVFTGIDVPIKEVSDVIVTKIQNNMGPVLQSLRNALNPIADQLITKADVDANITENGLSVGNVINGVSRDNIGKSWVIPVGILKSQVDILTAGSWVTVRAIGTGINVTVDTNQLKQYASEGWVYTDTTSGNKEYYVYPLLFTFEDLSGVVKQPFDLTAGVSVGRWVPWFTNYQRTVNFEYSIRQAEVSEVGVIMPTAELLDRLITAGAGAGFEFVDPTKFRIETEVDGTMVKVNDLLVNSEDGKLIPLFVRYEATQIERAVEAVTVSTINVTRYTLDEFGNMVGVPAAPIELTRAQIKNTPLIDGHYYFTIGHAVEGIQQFNLTVTATADYDSVGQDWLSSTVSLGAGGIPAYAVDCTGALNHAGVIEVENMVGTTLVSSNGAIIHVTDDNQFVNLLRVGFGLDVIELTHYVDPSDLPPTEQEPLQ